MGGQLMPPPRLKQEPIEFLQEDLAPALFVRESFPLCPTDLPLRAILVQPPEDLLEPGSEIDRVQIERLGRLRIRWRHAGDGPRADLDVIPFFRRSIDLERAKQEYQIVGATDQRLAVIGER